MPATNRCRPAVWASSPTVSCWIPCAACAASAYRWCASTCAESTRHTEAIAELTRYLGLGDYESWSEADKQAFLIRELNSKRPLVPLKWQPSADTQEVLETCRVIAEAPQGSIAAYVISMARTPSDVLAVHLLLKEAGCPFALPVAPLFETLDDLNNADDVMTQLLNIDWYRGFIQGKQMVMIGYSDSAKDAGVMALHGRSTVRRTP